MILLDVNIVVAASRTDHPHHDRVGPWMNDLTAGSARFTVPDVVWSSFIRLVTNRRTFPVPTPTALAFEYLSAVRAAPAHQPTVAGERHLGHFRRLCVEGQATGDLVPDAYIAALAIEQGAAVATLDRDFARFEGLRVITPPRTETH